MRNKNFRVGFSLFATVILGIAGFMAIGSNHPAFPTAQAAHDTITSYNGPSTCLACHQEEAEEMFGSVHYQWTGPSPNVTNIDTFSGKADINFNTYCGSVITSRRIACWTCHAGYGKVPQSASDAAQLANIDCLTCHQDAYRRKAAPPYVQLTYTGYDAVTRTWTLPDEDANGNFSFMPDEAAMGISALTAARTVHLPTRTTCLSCHAYAAGSDCGKRGDLSTETRNPPLWAEVHMSAEGEDLHCTACHSAGNHRVRGRGLDITTNDHPDRLTCTSGGCHPVAPHENTRLDNHTGRVACQTCHIPTYAKLKSTEMARDWRFPVFFQGMLGGQGGFKPEETREVMVTPSYRWFDGRSANYVLSLPGSPTINSQGVYEFALPLGGVRFRDALIYPMKEHNSNSAMHTSTGRMIPHSTFIYFVTGDFSRAVAEAQARVGLPGPWSLVNVHTYQTINHGVEPSGNALDCGECHSSLSEGRPVRMNLQGDLGYTPRVKVKCTKCHTQKEAKPFVDFHDKHVRDKKIECVSCHYFERPPRE